MDETSLEEIDLENIFEIGSKFVELDDINEKEKARFLVQLV